MFGRNQNTEETSSNYSTLLRTLALGVAGGATYFAHNYLLENDPAYTAGMYNWAKKLEALTPNNIGTTFGLSERASSYALNDIFFDQEQLIGSYGELTETGAHFQRVFGDKFDVSKVSNKGLRFKRLKTGPFLEAESVPGVHVRFAPAGARFSGASYRYNRPLQDIPFRVSQEQSFSQRVLENFHNLRYKQNPRSLNPIPGSKAIQMAIPGLHTRFIPWYTKFDAADQSVLGRVRAFAGNARRAIGPQAFELFERPQSLLSDIGLGLSQGSYNKVFNTPFIGEGGLLNNLLLKRVLLIAVGLTALKWLDYKTGHKASNAIIDLPLKANVLRAELTDRLPFARKITDWYKDKEQDLPQYAPFALPLGGMFAGSLLHMVNVVRGKFSGGTSDRLNKIRRAAAAAVFPRMRVLFQRSLKEETVGAALKTAWSSFGTPGKGALIGAVLALPFVPGMLGSRKSAPELRRIYSGEQDVPIRQGRWWEVGSTPFGGTRITAWRPHESIILKSHAREKSLYGSEKNYWKHNPILHPLRWLRDPYYLENLHYEDRPYPITSPAFSNIPLIGPLLAATIGKAIKPPKRMHEDEWQEGDNYNLYSSRLEPKGPDALAPSLPKEEFSLWHSFKQEVRTMAEFIGLPGFLMKSVFNKAYPSMSKQDVYLQGSRQMDSLSRSYYEKDLGAGMFFSPEMDAERWFFGYSEPLRRLIQHEGFSQQVNELENTMPSWMPGKDYLINFKKGDPYIKLDQGYARLPGEGYNTLHPELADVDPENYSDITKLKILGDVAPYSREYQKTASSVRSQMRDDPNMQLEYETISEQVRQTKASTLQVDKRHFNAPVDSIEGTVKSFDRDGIELNEYKGRVFHFSSVGSSMSDLVAQLLGSHNEMTKDQAINSANESLSERSKWLTNILVSGTHVNLVVPRGAADSSTDINAVVSVDGDNINREIINRGYGVFRGDLGGAEEQAMHGRFGRAFGKYSEEMFFEGDQSVFNPMRYIPSPFHTKYAQTRSAYSQYKQQEAIGTRMRRWDKPIHDFIAPYVRGAISKVLGQDVIPEQVQNRRDLDTMADMLSYLRSLNASVSDPDNKGLYTSQYKRTNIGSNLYSDAGYVSSTLPTREARYFRKFVEETDPEVRQKILDIVPDESREALKAQWIKQSQDIQQASGEEVQGPDRSVGVPYTDEDVDEYKHSKSRLGLGDYLRSRKIANFFFSKHLNLPDADDTEVFNPDVDYQDVKLAFINQEGYDAHDFNIYDDRTSLLWRKPYVDGAVRELTSGNTRTQDQMRQAVEQMMLAAGTPNPDVRYTTRASNRSRANVKVTADTQEYAEKETLKDMRRNAQDYVDN